jgi:oxygen-independent coproporphyrinogen-3 oxidase
MTSLRTKEGLDLAHFQPAESNALEVASKKYLERNLIIKEQNHLKLTAEGKLLADGIAAELFLEEVNKIVE